MKLVRTSLVGLLLVIVLAVVVGFLLPSSVHVERSILVQSKAEEIFPYLNNFKLFDEWSPWAMNFEDQRYQFKYRGPKSGPGATMIWSGTDFRFGQGQLVILEEERNRKVRMRLDLGRTRREMRSALLLSFDLQPQGGQTKITWGMDSRFGYNLLARYTGLFFERWIGPDYEQGLQNLKQLLEARPRP